MPFMRILHTKFSDCKLDKNFDLADYKPKTQQFMVISNCGFPGNNNFETMKAVFAPCNPVLEIYRNCGKL